MHGKKNKTIGEGRRKAGNQREKLLDEVATRRMFHERANERATKQGRSTPCECRYTHGNDPERRPDHTSYTSYSYTPTPNPETGTTIFVTEFRGD